MTLVLMIYFLDLTPKTQAKNQKVEQHQTKRNQTINQTISKMKSSLWNRKNICKYLQTTY